MQGTSTSPATGSQVSPSECSIAISAAFSTCCGVPPSAWASPAAAIAEADSLLAPLPTARGEGNVEAATASSQSAGAPGAGESAEVPGLGNVGGKQ